MMNAPNPNFKNPTAQNADLKKPGHFAKRDYGMFNPTTTKIADMLGQFMTGRQVSPTDAQYDEFARMTLEGDPTADAVVEWFRDVSFPKGRAILQKALDEGIDAIDDPHPALINLFKEIDTEPFWLDRDLLEIATRAIHRTGPLGLIVLGDVALMGGYAISSVMNKSLVFTGALETGAEKRLAETASWWLDATATDGLTRFGAGTKTTVMVRVMHAMVRARLKVHPEWDFEELGMPISQAHMLATNNAFSVLFLNACGLLGVRFSKQERKAIMHLWRYAGILMGVDPRYISESEVEGLRAIWLSATTQPPPDEDAVALAKGLADMRFPLAPDGPIGDLIDNGLSGARLGITHMLGNQLYNDLGLPQGKSWRWFPLALRGAVLGTETARRITPGGTRLAERLGRQIQEGGYAVGKHEATFTPVEVLKKDREKQPA
ncbi:MAG: oxygenase MpaB family protein [Alphaproteobacteria bacterium]